MNIRNRIEVIIAEDEPIILSNIAKKVELTATYYHVVGQAENGVAALRLLKEHPEVSLLITDIEMPGMNGLQLIEEVRALYPQLHIIILSGYSNFEYARTALRYGVSDYLLKPITQDALSNVLDPISQIIFDHQNKEVRNILSTAIRGQEPDDLAPYHFKTGSFLLSFITLGNHPSRHIQEEVFPEDQSLWNEVDFNFCLQEHDAIERIWIIDENYSLQKMIISYTSKKILLSDVISQSFYHCLKSHLGTIPFSIYTSPRLISYQELWSEGKAIRNYSKIHTPLFSQFYEVIPTKKASSFVIKDELPNLKNDLMPYNSLTKLLPFIEHTLSNYHLKNTSQYVVEDFIFQLYTLMPTAYAIEEIHCLAEMNQILSKLYQYETLEELTTVIHNSVKNLFHFHSDVICGDTLCNRVKQYIHQHYNQKISLNKLAERYGYTTSYLHRTFKKEMGISPLQYITTIRLNHAKEILLEDPELDIKEVSYKVGYDDPRYFSRVFKNELGTTPTNWLKNNLPFS